MISTGLQKLDNFLLGGIPNGIIIDIFGANGTGKTQLSLQFSINSIQNGGSILYVDTTGGFRPERVIEIQKKSNLDYDLLEKITVSRVTNTSEQINLLDNFNISNFSLIVIDNITDLFSYEYQTDDSIFEKNTLFMKYMKRLSEIAVNNKIPIVITNMVRSNGSNEIENMKHAINPFTHVKIYLFKKSLKFFGKIYCSNKQDSFQYEIHPSGLIDST